jgi:hypothetical protein
VAALANSRDPSHRPDAPHGGQSGPSAGDRVIAARRVHPKKGVALRALWLLVGIMFLVWLAGMAGAYRAPPWIHLLPLSALLVGLAAPAPRRGTRRRRAR